MQGPPHNPYGPGGYPPQHQPGYGYPPRQGWQGPPPGWQHGGPPFQPKKKSNVLLWILLGLVALIVVPSVLLIWFIASEASKDEAKLDKAKGRMRDVDRVVTDSASRTASTQCSWSPTTKPLLGSDAKVAVVYVVAGKIQDSHDYGHPVGSDGKAFQDCRKSIDRGYRNSPQSICDTFTHVAVVCQTEYSAAHAATGYSDESFGRYAADVFVYDGTSYVGGFKVRGEPMIKFKGQSDNDALMIDFEIGLEKCTGGSFDF